MQIPLTISRLLCSAAENAHLRQQLAAKDEHLAAALKLMEEAEKKFSNQEDRRYNRPQLVVELFPLPRNISVVELPNRSGKSKLGSVRKLEYYDLDYSLADYTQLGKMLRCCVSLETLSFRWENKQGVTGGYNGPRLDNAGLAAMLAGPPLLSVKTLDLYDEEQGPTALPSLANAFPNLEHLSMRLGRICNMGTNARDLGTVGSLDALVSLKTLSIFGLYNAEGLNLDKAHAVVGKATLAKLKERGVKIMGGSYWG